MPKPTSAAEPTPVRVVIVTMDSHLAGAVERARRALRARAAGPARSRVHAAAEWGNDPAALERCRADIAQGDIVVATMLFMEDHIRPVLPALQARRDHCDAMVCAMSAGEVMRLTRIGRFSMDGTQSGADGAAEAAARRQASGSRRQRRRAADDDAAPPAAASCASSPARPRTCAPTS